MPRIFTDTELDRLIREARLSESNPTTDSTNNAKLVIKMLKIIIQHERANDVEVHKYRRQYDSVWDQMRHAFDPQMSKKIIAVLNRLGEDIVYGTFKTKETTNERIELWQAADIDEQTWVAYMRTLSPAYTPFPSPPPVGVKEAMSYHERKKARADYFERFVRGWKTRPCSACMGSGRYDHNGSPRCRACDGTGKERYKPGAEAPHP